MFISKFLQNCCFIFQSDQSVSSNLASFRISRIKCTTSIKQWELHHTCTNSQHLHIENFITHPPTLNIYIQRTSLYIHQLSTITYRELHYTSTISQHLRTENFITHSSILNIYELSKCTYKRFYKTSTNSQYQRIEDFTTHITALNI